MIPFLPSFLQGKAKLVPTPYLPLTSSPSELIDGGVVKALLRLGKQLLSFSPAFELFSTHILSHSITTSLTFGGARYIATGKGLATSRRPFYVLFLRFAGPVIYLGVRTLIMLLYITMATWTPWIIYIWAWILTLCISPSIHLCGFLYRLPVRPHPHAADPRLTVLK